MVPATLSGRLGGSPADWLVSRLHPRSRIPTQRVADIGKVLHVWEIGSLYRPDGTGFLFGPVGTPIAYIDTRIAPSDDGSVDLSMTAQMGPVQVDSGETRWSQQVLLLVEPPQQALARWAEWVGKTHGARSTFGALSGWSSSHYLVGAVNGKEVLKVTDAVLRHGDEVRFGVVEAVFNGEEEAPDQPLPASTSVASEAAKISSRPEQFVNSSPIPKNVKSKDPLAAGLGAAAVAGSRAAGRAGRVEAHLQSLTDVFCPWLRKADSSLRSE